MTGVPADARLEQLERRVRTDPTSVAFAALAEEYRRAGRLAEAISTCRTGLTRHPAYLSARVTLGRALMESGAFEEAEAELQRVVTVAPENLAAIKGLAEIHQRRGPRHQRDEPSEPAAAPPPVAAVPSPTAELPAGAASPAKSVVPEPPAVAKPLEPPAKSVAPEPPVVARPPEAVAKSPVPEPPALEPFVEPAPAFEEAPPEPLAASPASEREPAQAAPEPPSDDPVIADLEDFLERIVARREGSAPR